MQLYVYVLVVTQTSTLESQMLVEWFRLALD